MHAPFQVCYTLHILVAQGTKFYSAKLFSWFPRNTGIMSRQNINIANEQSGSPDSLPTMKHHLIKRQYYIPVYQNGHRITLTWRIK